MSSVALRSCAWETLKFGVYSAAGAAVNAAGMAATAAIWSNPIGAAGAATFGAIGFLMVHTVDVIVDKAFSVEVNDEGNKETGHLSDCAKAAYVICRLVGIIGASIASLEIARSLGVAITFKASLILGLEAGALALATVAILAIVGLAAICLCKPRHETGAHSQMDSRQRLISNFLAHHRPDRTS